MNLAVNYYLYRHPLKNKVISLIHRLMKKLGNPNIGGELCRLSGGKLSAVRYNKTRWSGKFTMLQRYFKIEDSGYFNQIAAIKSYQLSPGARRIARRTKIAFERFLMLLKSYKVKILLWD
jgi:hypothetical protein